MDIKDIKLPKLRKIISQLIVSSPYVPRGSEKAFLKIAERSQRNKVEELYNIITKSKKTEKLTVKQFRSQVLEKKAPLKSFKHGMIKLTSSNISKYEPFGLYNKTAKRFLQKYPNSLYKFKIRYYKPDGTEVLKFFGEKSFTEAGAVINNSKGQPIREIITPWNYTFQHFNKSILNEMRSQTTLNNGTYEWHPAYFLRKVYPTGYVIFTAETYAKVDNINKAISRIQKYKNNNTNTCVYDGCVKYFEMKMNRNEKDRDAKCMYNKLIKSRLQYATEYTDETLCKIGQLVKASIVIKDFVNGEDKEFNKDQFNKFRIEFMNTRYNHLELCTASFNEPIQVDTIEELQRIKDVNEYYIEKYGVVYTCDNVYKVKDSEFKTVFKQWKNDINFNNYSISVNSETFNFLNEYDFVVHRFINNLPIDNNLYKELDLKKAYHNYSNKEFNKYYVGVPSGAFIHCHCNDTFDYKKLSNKIVGFFEVKIISIHNNKLIKLGFTIGSNYIFFTSMINLLLEHCELQFINASYCPSVHIPFTEEFLNKEDGISHYCKAVGIFQSINNKIDTNIKILNKDIKYYSIINSPDCSYYRDQNIIHISRDNMDVKSYRHIALAIHSYNHTLVLSEMLNYNIDDIFGVKLDSIIIKKDIEIIENPIFKIKEANIENLLKNWGLVKEIEKQPVSIIQELNKLEEFVNTSIKEFKKIDTSDLDVGLSLACEFEDLETIIDFKVSMDDIITSYIRPSNNKLVWQDYFLYTDEYVYQTVIVIGGKGGTGKTNSVLRFLSIKNTCYSTVCWNLIEGVKRKYPDIIGLSIPKLTGEMDGQKVEKSYRPDINNIVLDEGTLLDYNKEIKVICKDYSHCFIFILGDVDFDGSYYQCSMMNKVINPSKVKCQYVQYTKTYRFDSELDNNLNQLREKMIEYKGDTSKLNRWFKQSEFKSRVFHINDIVYNDNDVGISCNNEMGEKSKHLTDKFIARGTKPKYFIKTTYLHKKMMRGAELPEKPNHSNFEMKLFKTIHSFQGLELTNDNNIIIDLSCIFDFNLLYTAMSRAKRMDQIYIIKQE